MVPIHNARRFALTFIFSLVSVCTVSTILAADTLDELLGGERTVLKEPSPATKKLWEDLLTALEKSDIEASRRFPRGLDWHGDCSSLFECRRVKPHLDTKLGSSSFEPTKIPSTLARSRRPTLLWRLPQASISAPFAC